MRSLSGHIGARVSALVDGQLSPQEEERAWAHALECPGCRRLVQHEGWTKQRLGSLSGGVPDAPPSRLLGSLYAVDAWAAVEEIEQRSTRRRTAALVGGGAVGAAVLGLVAVTGPSVGRGDLPTRPSPATIRNDSSPRGPVGSSPGWATGDGTTSVGLVRRTR